MAKKSRGDHYTKFQELAHELKAISHPNKEQECLREVLRAAAL